MGLGMAKYRSSQTSGLSALSRKATLFLIAAWLIFAQSQNARAALGATFEQTVAMSKFKLLPTANECYELKPNFNAYPGGTSNPIYQDDFYSWENCTNLPDEFESAFGFSGLSPLPIGSSARARASRVNTGSTPALALSSSAPTLPFLGNRLSIVSYVLNAAVASDATAAYQVGLRRQSDCSLAEDLVLPGAATPDVPSADFVTTLAGAQDNFHQLAGLTTLPDVFAKGCNYPYAGQPSASDVYVLGTTADGAVITAEPASAGLYISITDPTLNTYKTTLAFPSTSLGGFSVADINGDGILDLVLSFVTDPATQQLSTGVFLGNGDGTFRPGVYYDTPGDVTIDDFNGDGKLDILICGLSSGVTTLIGKGDGTFTPTALSATGITPCGPVAGQVVTGDFNGDGKKDLLVHDTVLLGAGDGTFTIGSSLPVNAGLFLDELGNTAVGDLNNDGKLDVVVAQSGVIVVFYGNGDGTFTAGPRYAGLPGLNPLSLTDIDGDGNLDILIGTNAGGAWTASCCGNGSALEPPLFQILMGRGDGTFVDSLVYNQGHFGNFNLAVGPQIATADFNGDGNADAAVFTAANGGTITTSTVTLLPGDGTGRLGTAIASSVILAPSMLVTASINKSGRADLVLAGTLSGTPAIATVRSQGDGTFAGELDYMLPSPAVSLVTGDFNGDGIIDIAVGVSPALGNAGASGVYVLFGQANGTFAPAVKIDSSQNPTGLAAGDINMDGKSDLIVADQGTPGSSQASGALHVYLGNSNGTFTAAASPVTAATNYSVIALGDLNADGKIDLIVAGNLAGNVGGSSVGAPTVYTLLGKGDGSFQAPTALALAGVDGIGATSIALADFNKDGHLDVAIGNANDFTEVLLGMGDGTLVDTALTLAQQPLALAAVDLNGDGFPELLVGTADVTGTGNLAVLLNGNTWGMATAPAMVVVPDVVNLTQAAATTSITGVGLVIGTLTSQTSATVTSGNIISESPGAGTSVATGASVNLVVSTGPASIAVPNVVGLSQTSASTGITTANLTLGTVTQQSSGTVASGDVISESPAAATNVAPGSSVNLVVSSGPAASSATSSGGGGSFNWQGVFALLTLAITNARRRPRTRCLRALNAG